LSEQPESESSAVNTVAGVIEPSMMPGPVHALQCCLDLALEMVSHAQALDGIDEVGRSSCHQRRSYPLFQLLMSLLLCG